MALRCHASETHTKHLQPQLNMQVAVISDLHLGLGDSADSFGHADDVFEAFVRRLESDFDQIVLLGDIWETLTSERLYAPIETLRRAKEAHPTLARRFEGEKYFYVHGNHDLIAHTTCRAPSELILDDGSARLLFTHGHHHDWLIRRARWLSECCVWLGGWSRRLKMSAVYQVGYQLDAFFSASAGSLALDSFQRWALALAGQRSADVVVTGHTHVAHRNENEGRIFLNSGSCSEGALTYLAIDTRTASYEVCAA